LRAKNTVLIASLVITVFFISASFAAQSNRFRFETHDTTGMAWFKGNTHTHTLESDGDSPPEEVATWYKENGYDFLVLSDHNVLTNPAILSHIVDETFILIPGEEVTSSFEDSSVHINGININTLVIPQTAETLVGTIQKNVDAIREVEGAPHINHPNFGWSFGAEELAQVENNRLLEIYNGHPTVHNNGGGDALGLEAIWDHLLTRGKRIYGIAVDDAHDFQTIGRDRSNPGRGWVTVRARSLDAYEIVTHLEEGLFYASTGVDLDDIRVNNRRLEIQIRQRGNFKYLTRFIGAGGKVLYETPENPAVFELRGPEVYVRAVVYDSGGWRAWVQPVFTVSN